MFDTKKVASNIKNARTKMNMTQMNLADEMGVSYQAVSNWERGNSMPDISKLPELCKILNISFEELVGERTAETAVAEKLMKDEDADVTLEEMAQVGQLVKPDKIEQKVNEEMDKGKKIPFSTLVSLAPFMDRETLNRQAEELAEKNIKKLSIIAPFIDRETLDRIIDKCIEKEQLDVKRIVSIAPFLSSTSIQKIGDYLIEHGQSRKLVALAPFMGNAAPAGMFASQMSDVCTSTDEDDGMEEADARRVDLANAALDYLDEDEVAEIAFAALEGGKPIDCYLDYMKEEDIKRLMLKSLEKR